MIDSSSSDVGEGKGIGVISGLSTRGTMEGGGCPPCLFSSFAFNHDGYKVR
jgi:hypothetical protein